MQRNAENSGGRGQVRTVCQVVVLASLLLGNLTSPGQTIKLKADPDRRDTSGAALKDVLEPLELSGPAAPKPKPAPPVASAFLNSKALLALDPKKPATFVPAMRDLDRLLAMAPDNSDLFLVRAQLRCYLKQPATEVLADIDNSIRYRNSSSVGGSYRNLATHYALAAKIRLLSGRQQEALEYLDKAVAEDYRNAEDVFNNGEVKSHEPGSSCDWTDSDLEGLIRRFPADYRPHLYLALRQMFFRRFGLTADLTPAIRQLDKASELAPRSPLPYYYKGVIYSSYLGGILSTVNAECLDWVVPRTEACKKRDEVMHQGMRSYTHALAVDPTFRPAYLARAGAFLSLKDYPQAIRDFSSVLEVNSKDDLAHGAYNDRAIAETELKQYEAAIDDLTHALEFGCENLCFAYESRSLAYQNLRQYAKAADDLGRAIRHQLANAVYLMGVEQFRKTYPEYDAVPDHVLCERLRSLFFPQMTYDDFSRRFLIEAKGLRSTVVPDLYVRRGDLYDLMGLNEQAEREYDRVSSGFPEYAPVVFEQRNGKRTRKIDPD